MWSIIYPVATYYAAITIGMYVAQMFFGAGIENYMLCKLIGSLVAIPVVYKDYKKDRILSGNWKKEEGTKAIDIMQVISVVGLTILLSISLNNIICMSPLVAASEEYENASNAFYGSTLIIELLSSALVTPFLEELLHRGVVYQRLRKRFGVVASILVSSLIFAVLHFNIVQFIYAFLLGAVFAIFVEKTGKLYWAIVAHIVANAIAVIRTETGFLQELVDGSGFAWGVSVVMCVVGIIGLVIYTKKECK